MHPGEIAAIVGGLLFLSFCGLVALVMIGRAIARRRRDPVAEVYRVPKGDDPAAHVTIADLVGGEIDREKAKRRRQKTVDKLLELFDGPN